MRLNEERLLNFSPIAPADLNECAALFASVFNGPPWNEDWDVEAARQRLEDCYRTPGYHGLLAKNGDEVVGFALGFIESWDKSKNFHLKEICVASALQRSGVGTALLGALEESLEKQNVKRLYLHTARDTSAHAFYEKQGFYASSKMITMVKRLESN